MKKNILVTVLPIAILAISIFFFVNQYKDVQLNEKSQSVFEKSIRTISKSRYTVNIDSFQVIYEKYKHKNPQAGLDFANSFYNYSIKLFKERKYNENVKEAKERQKEIEKEERDKKSFENSKYGKFLIKLQEKYPKWTIEECRKVVSKQIWIGMRYEMLVYQRGKPNTINPSNYGNGVHYQYCWDDYTPSCFYSEEDNIITAYN